MQFMHGRGLHLLGRKSPLTGNTAEGNLEPLWFSLATASTDLEVLGPFMRFIRHAPPVRRNVAIMAAVRFCSTFLSMRLTVSCDLLGLIASPISV
jgi:hypothetical protein